MDGHQELSFYEAVGGEETFRRLTRLFSRGRAADPRAARRLPQQGIWVRPRSTCGCSLIQLLGAGPATYNELLGPPAAADAATGTFAIGEAERDAWLRPHARGARPDRAWSPRSTPSSGTT